MGEDTDLIPVFIPSLGVLLVAAEDKKGEPLTNDEVIAIRDRSACIMMTVSDAAKMADSRGSDIDPENCWYDWQMLRRELNRKPDLDPGARVNMFRSSDPAYLESVASARSTLSDFRSMLPQYDPYSCLIKTELDDGDGSGFVWLFNTRQSNAGFVAELFEVPPSVSRLEVGQEFDIADADVIDWMINDDGTLYGGFSLRYHRANLSPDEQLAFDAHVGVTTYA